MKEMEGRKGRMEERLMAENQRSGEKGGWEEKPLMAENGWRSQRRWCGNSGHKSEANGRWKEKILTEKRRLEKRMRPKSPLNSSHGEIQELWRFQQRPFH
jgi:hypothetical protein